MVSPDKDSMLDTLTLLEMYLVKFVSTGQNLKLAMATGFSTKVPSDIPNNITLYELWGEEDSN
ncbi:protein FAM209A-like [Oryx dammah]|uniref:protein FAM209A-like n=1 Tax=Oryx dammah TaxID=59534 RepID=UPI001A9C165A|nr:protein FAM209A-like [Oryx dammah]